MWSEYVSFYSILQLISDIVLPREGNSESVLIRSPPFCLVLTCLSGTSDKHDIRPVYLNDIRPGVIMISIDLIRLNEILDKLTQNKFLELCRIKGLL